MTTIKPDQAVEAITPDLLFRLLGAAHAVTERLEGALRALGLTSATFDLLSELVNANRPLELEDLMTRVSDEPSGIGHLIEGLERDGFVRRMPHGAAESGVRVVITARGRARQQAGFALMGTVREELRQAVERLDAAAVERALSALR